jgi:hypothetical protein
MGAGQGLQRQWQGGGVRGGANNESEASQPSNTCCTWEHSRPCDAGGPSPPSASQVQHHATERGRGRTARPSPCVEHGSARACPCPACPVNGQQTRPRSLALIKAVRPSSGEPAPLPQGWPHAPPVAASNAARCSAMNASTALAETWVCSSTEVDAGAAERAGGMT